MTLSPDQKIAGVLTPLFALRTEDDLGIGDLAALRQFVDWAASIGFKLVQLLPINETGGDNSPYNAISATAIEPLTLHLAPGSPEDLTQEDYDEVLAAISLAKLRTGPVSYREVRKLKRALLEKAFARFQGRADAAESFTAFCEKEASWLEPYVFFRVLMEENGESEAWDLWREEHQSVEAAHAWLKAEPAAAQERFAERAQFFRYVQWLAYDQWIAVKNYADERGVALMGDIPFGVSYYSADVYSWPDRFKLDWSGGAPPEPYFKDDEFTQKWGQNWGIPLYNWEAMRAHDFAWWRQRVRGVRRIFHVFRIDHVLGFYRIYAFPWRPQRNPEFLPLSCEEMLEKTGGRAPGFAPRDDEAPDRAAANRREGEEYLRMALEAAGSTRLVGEDLGTVPPYVRPSLQSLGISRLQDSAVGEHAGWPDRPRARNTSGSRSRPTLRTITSRCARCGTKLSIRKARRANKPAAISRRSRALRGSKPSARTPDYERDFYPASLRGLFRSNSWMAIVMITDLLGGTERFNVPGTAADSNWSQRLRFTMKRLRTRRALKERMKLVRSLLEKTGRV